uniref:CMP/dCMP-type deaminase domain-containing protein n=1 Tax=Pipistrellus kuhlii TaxID=59472 RepID=A0A7J7ZFS1_PIPKU|nr:hypothetical protein mPipKuh1_000831 [Pipistrellus kuhlii]
MPRQRRGLRARPRRHSAPVPWPSNPVSRFSRHYFYFHFTNQPYPEDRKGCYLCFRVERTQGGLSSEVGSGVFENEFYPKEPVHAEICFLNWFKAQPAFQAQRLAPEEKYQVTWFMSWSPCFQCARQVAKFLRDHTSVQLSILAARLYYPRRPQYQQGLRSLQGAGAHVAVMTPADFASCWEMFVDDHKKRFWYWKGIYINSCSLAKSLEDILGQGVFC